MLYICIVISNEAVTLKNKNMKAICNITGIEFETESNRQKNHPEISKIMSDLNARKDGSYKLVKENLTKKKGSFTSLENVINFINSNECMKNNKIVIDIEDKTSCIDYM